MQLSIPEYIFFKKNLSIKKTQEKRNKGKKKLLSLAAKESFKRKKKPDIHRQKLTPVVAELYLNFCKWFPTI